jgi:hypothetical protein
MPLASEGGLTAMASSFYFRYQRKLSLSFLRCLTVQITEDFERLTGLATNVKKTSLSGDFDLDKMQLTYGPVSSFYTRLYVNHHWPTCKICWSSTSGQVYKLEDEIEDCSDVRFWLEELDVVAINMMMHPDGNPFPIKTKAWGFALEINGLETDISTRLHLLPHQIAEAEQLITAIDSFIETYNQASEKNHREYGLVHNWKRRFADGMLYFDIDLGSADMKFLGKWLKFLHTLNSFSKVEIE